MASHVANVAQQEIGPTWRGESRPLPDNNVTITTIPGIGGDEVKSDFFGIGCRGDFEAEFLVRNERVDRLKPGFRTGQFANMTDAIELP